MRRFGGSSAALVYVVQDNIDEEVRRIVDTSTLDSQAAKVLSESVPSVKLAEIHIIDLKRGNIFECEQRNGCVERKLLISCNQTSFVVRSQAQARNLGESRIQVSQVFLQQSLLLLSFGCAVRANTQSRPERRHARHDTAHTGHRVDRVSIRILLSVSLGIAEERYVVGWRSIRVNILEADIHGPNWYTCLLEAREQVE